jgi:hypothetical protein
MWPLKWVTVFGGLSASSLSSSDYLHVHQRCMDPDRAFSPFKPSANPVKKAKKNVVLQDGKRAMAHPAVPILPTRIGTMIVD